MGSAGHSEHFLRRLDRVADHHVELALTLYRDSELLRDVLSRAGVESARVAISLADPIEGPFVIVTREGRFVTCLGPGMHVDEKEIAIVTRPRLDAAISKVERMRERVAEVDRLHASGGEGTANRLLVRMRKDGLRFCREDFETLSEVWPLVGDLGPTMLTHGVRMLRENREEMAYLRYDKLHADDEERVRVYGEIAWTCGHLLVLTDHDASAEVIDAIAEVVNARAAWTTALFDLATYFHVTRALWVVARHGKAMLPALKALRNDPRHTTRLFREAGLGAIALASPKLRAEATKALWTKGSPIDLQSSPFTQRLVGWSDAAADLVRHVLENVEQTRGDYDTYGRAVAARFTHRTADPTDEQQAAIPEAVARAFPACLSASVLGVDEKASERMLLAMFALPFVTSASAADLYLPRAHAAHLRETGAADAIEMMREYGAWNLIGRPKSERRAEAKVGRNDPCPCGSGKKYKRCCARS